MMEKNKRKHKPRRSRFTAVAASLVLFLVAGIGYHFATGARFQNAHVQYNPSDIAFHESAATATAFISIATMQAATAMPVLPTHTPIQAGLPTLPPAALGPLQVPSPVQQMLVPSPVLPTVIPPSNLRPVDPSGMVPLIVALEDIAAGDTIPSEALVITRWPLAALQDHPEYAGLANQLLEGDATHLVQYPEQLIGAVAIRDFRAFQPIRLEWVEPPGHRPQRIPLPVNTVPVTVPMQQIIISHGADLTLGQSYMVWHITAWHSQEDTPSAMELATSQPLVIVDLGTDSSSGESIITLAINPSEVDAFEQLINNGQTFMLTPR